MKQLTVPKRPARLAVISSLQEKLRYLFDLRAVHISKMSGYPLAIHSIGRLQKIIDPTSIQTLIASVYKVQQIANITAEVIDTLEGTKPDKFQLNRTEIVTYVTNMVEKMPDAEMSSAEIDVISNLIVSFEANPANWNLESADDSSNLHLQFYNLYKEVLLTTTPGQLPAFSPLRMDVLKFAELDHVKSLAAAIKAKKKTTKEEGEGTTQADEDTQIFQNACVIYQLALCRFVDHVYQLLLDKDIWYSFVTPRSKADVGTNIARSQSLRALYTYCQSLLTYYQFFTIEMFLSSYNLIQEWITHFPPLEATVTYELENIIRKHDLLGAKRDVDRLMASFSENAKTDLDAIAFPSEFLDKFGLGTSIKMLQSKAEEYSFTGNLSSIEELNRPQYIPLLSGTSIGVLDAIPTMANMILTHKTVSEEIRVAMAGLVPVLTRGSRRSDIEAVRGMNINAGMPFIIPAPASYQIMAGVSKGIENGAILSDSLSPQFSFHYHQYLRDSMSFKMKTDSSIVAGYEPFDTVNIVDFDKAKELCTILGVSWRTLVPSTWSSADRTYTIKEMADTYERVKQLVEDLTSMNYDTFIRQLTLPHVTAMFATVISSFGTLYRRSDAKEEILSLSSNFQFKNSDLSGLVAVEGYGRPYGTVYPALAAAQGDITAKTKLIKLGLGFYIRVHEKIPAVIDELQLDPVFYNQRQVLYFSSNSSKIPVDRWVLGDPMLNFALVPMKTTARAPKISITPKHVYLTTRLYVNYDLYYKPAVPEKAREKADVVVQVKDWKDIKNGYFLEYRTFGNYSASPNIVEESNAEMLITATTKIEKLINASAEEAKDDVTGAGAKVKKVTAEAESNVAEVGKVNVNEKPGSTEHEITL